MLLRKNKEMEKKTFQNKWGGEGEQRVIHILNSDEMHGKARLFADNYLEPGASIGLHAHNGETEAYYFLEGNGIYSNDGDDYEIEAGDVAVVDDQHKHGVRNTGDTPLRFIALILYTNSKR